MGRWKTGTWVASGVISACLALLQGACGPSSAPPSTGATLRPAPVDSSDPYARLQAQLASLRVSGKVATSTGLLLPERIRIEVRSEICVETRRPGARFWAMDFDTCFVYSAIDTVDSTGMYQVSVPCIDADRDYEASTPRMDYRLVPRGPVTFLAESDAGWRHQETFTSSRNQRRDLKLTLHTETFFVVHDQAAIVASPEPGAAVLQVLRFGGAVEVIRFHQGWAECLLPDRIGWIAMRGLGTEREVRDLAPFRGKPRIEKAE